MLLLTLVTLPVVVGAAVLIYQYMKYSVLVERRLKGERWMVPSRLYARPLVLRAGLLLSSADLVKILNDLKYEQKATARRRRESSRSRERSVRLLPRPAPDAADGAPGRHLREGPREGDAGPEDQEALRHARRWSRS